MAAVQPTLLDVQFGDLATVSLLVILEGLLSADNALVMAVMVLGLPREHHQRALRYGLVGGFGLRTIATVLAAHLMRVVWVKLVGGLYLLYLTYRHFRRPEAEAGGHVPPLAKPMLGLSAFWATVVRVELVNLAFSVDSILVAVAMSTKLWVVVTGGLLGIVAMRVVAGQLIELIRRYPAMVDGAFVIIGWVGAKLLVEYAWEMHWLGWKVPQWLSMGLIGVIFLLAFLHARRQAAGTGSGEKPPAV